MSNYKGLFTFDEDSHKYVPIPIAGAERIIDAIGHKPAEPLIKDGKIRKAVRAWAEANSICRAIHYKTAVGTELIEINYEQPTDQKAAIEFNKYCGLEESKEYTIAELCGKGEE